MPNPNEKDCAECKKHYPREILNEMYILGEYTKPICGICALKLANEIHGLVRDKFTAPMAEEYRQRAIDWRKRTGQDDSTPAL